jgi:hypothetical protein
MQLSAKPCSIFKEAIMLRNGSFEEGWTDLPPAPGHLINQQPQGWTLRWIEPGESLFGANDTAGGVPECVHKLAHQLPPNEQPGGPDALILEGTTTYKIFHANAAFGAELKQTVTGLRPGSSATLTVPILAVLHGEPDPFGAESGVWVNGEGQWVNGGTTGNRNWFTHTCQFTVPENGQAEVVIRVKSKWPRPKDFFVDHVRLQAETGEAKRGDVPPIPDPLRPGVVLNVPENVQVITSTAKDIGAVIIIAPEGLEVTVKRTE